MMGFSSQRRLPLTIALIFGLVVIGAILSISHGSKPSAGALYTGTVVVQTPTGKVRGDRPVAFHVGASADTVRAFSFASGIPSLCRDTASATVSGTGAIVSPSRFLVRLAINRGATRIGTLTISGTFGALGREAGAFTTSFSRRDLRGCGASGGYSTKSGGI